MREFRIFLKEGFEYHKFFAQHFLNRLFLGEFFQYFVR